MADVTFTIAFKDDGTPVLKNIQSTAQQMGAGVAAAGQQAAGGLSGMAAASKKTESSFASLAARATNLSGIFAALGVSVGVAQIVQATDTYAQLAGRLRLVTDSTAQLTQVQQSLFDVAQRTSTSYEGTVDLYTRLARSTQSLGLNQQALLEITDTVNQALAVSGASASSAQAALVQLGQSWRARDLR